MLDETVVCLRANKGELLLVLNRPEIPPHTSASEGTSSSVVTKRTISRETRSDVGKRARHTFLSLLKTCTMLAVSFSGVTGGPG